MMASDSQAMGRIGEVITRTCHNAHKVRVQRGALVGETACDNLRGATRPRKGGPGVTESDLLIVNKTDLAPHVGPDLGVMERDARRMRGEGPTVFAQVTRGVGIEAIAAHVLAAWRAAVGGGERGPYAPGEHAG